MLRHLPRVSRGTSFHGGPETGRTRPYHHRPVPIEYQWRGRFDNVEVEKLHAEAFGHDPQPTADWSGILERHSLGWVCAHDEVGLVGLVNVAWDGAAHAFLLDTIVANRARRRGIGTRLVEIAADHAREAGCEWLHVDFEEHLRSFYFEACGFRPTDAGLIRL